MDVADLRAAYERFFAVASAAAGSEAIDAHGWSAAMVVAHIAANDRLMAAHLRHAVDGLPTRYSNLDVYRAVDLRPIVERTPRVADLIEAGRAASDEFLELAEGLEERQAALAFRTTILDGDAVQVDADLPLAGLLGAQVHVHLPLHTAQIEALAGA